MSTATPEAASKTDLQELAADVVERALRAGATTVRPLENAPYGDRTATVEDPAGNLWSIATQIKEMKF